MSINRKPGLSPAETEIVSLVWKFSKATFQDVHAALPRTRNIANAIVVTAACLAVLWSCSSASAATLLGYWQFEETDVSQPAIDSSGNGLDGTYENAVDPNVPGAPGFGSGADFDGTTGQVLIGPGFATGFGNLTEDFTVMAWINPDNFDHKNRVMGASPNAAWGWGTAGAAGNLEITTFGVKDYTQPVPIVANEWTHAAVVLDANFAAHFYVNGVLVGTITHPTSGNTSDNLFHIGWADGAGEHFDGQLDEVAVVDEALSAEDVNAIFLNGVEEFFFGPPGPPGDVDGNGVVDLLDYEIIRDHFKTGTTREEGNLDRRGVTDLADFRIWKTEFEKGAMPGSVPEPSSSALALVAFAWATFARRRPSRRPNSLIRR